MSAFRIAVQEIVVGEVTAWLLEDHTLPVVSLAWSFPGGAALDPPERPGTAALAAALLTEGAGELDATRFADALRDRAISLSFSAGRDGFDGGLRALSGALPEAVRLANLALAAPRFDPPALERTRARAIAGARRALETPRGQAARGFWAGWYPDHPAGRPGEGTAESLAALDVAALRDALGRQLRLGAGTGAPILAAAGAIDADGLSNLVPTLFAGLPEGNPPPLPFLPQPQRFGTRVIPVAAPQSSANFGQPGLPVDDPDWDAAGVVLRVLLGGGFASRLMQAVRERRGLAYGIGGGMETLFGQGAITGAVATENARIAETLAVVREEWALMARSGPTAAELADAVAYMTGSLPLAFSDTRRTAEQLLALRRNNRPPNWLNGRSQRLAALTQAEVARVAARLLDPDALSVVVAGEPSGL